MYRETGLKIDSGRNAESTEKLMTKRIKGKSL